MGDLTKNFSRNEFCCRCGCEFDGIDYTLVDMLQTIRSYVGFPFRISSGCRCKKHNKEVGGVRNSQHTLGKAADVHCQIGALELFRTVRKLYRMGAIPALGHAQLYVAEDFVHLDVRSKKSNTVKGWA